MLSPLIRVIKSCSNNGLDALAAISSLNTNQRLNSVHTNTGTKKSNHK